MSFAKSALVLVFAAVSFSGSASAQSVVAPKDSVKIFTIKDGDIDVVYTDRKGCEVRFREFFGNQVIIKATFRDTTQMATIEGDLGGRPWPISYDGQLYDRVKGPDLISRQCAPMINKIPNELVRKMALRTIVE